MNFLPALFKDGGVALVQMLTRFISRIWAEERIPSSWGSSLIIPIYKKGSRSECSNHRGISLVPVVTKLLTSLLLHPSYALSWNQYTRAAGWISAWSRLYWSNFYTSPGAREASRLPTSDNFNILGLERCIRLGWLNNALQCLRTERCAAKVCKYLTCIYTPPPKVSCASTGNYLSLSIPPAVYGKVARSPHFFSTLWWMKSCVLPWQSMKLWELIWWWVNDYAT